MPGKFKILSIVAVFLTVFAAGLHGAHAQDPCQGNRADGTLGVPGTQDSTGAIIPDFPPGWDQIYFDAGQLQLQDVSQLQFSVQQQVPHIDVKGMYCLNQIATLISLINTTTSTSSANLFSTIVAAVGTALENMIITQIENAVCALVNQVFSQVEQLAQQSMSVCMPLPHFKLPTFKIPDFLHRPPCNGVNILSPQFLNQQPVQGAPNLYKLMMGQ